MLLCSDLSVNRGNKMSNVIPRMYVGNLAARTKVILLALIIVSGACSSPTALPTTPTPRVLTTTTAATATQPSPTPIPPTATPDNCPKDPADWILTDNQRVLGSNLKDLSPQCVYNQLEKTAAWLYATAILGHTRSEAAGLLGIPDVPMDYMPSNQLVILTDYKDTPQTVEVRDSHNHPKLAEWRIDANGQPAAEYVFHGCFDTSSLDESQATISGETILVICGFHIYYQYEHIVSQVHDEVLTINNAKHVIRPTWFGYLSDERWVWLGDAPSWDIDLAKIKMREEPTLDPTIVHEKYGISSVPLPQDWESAVGQDFVDAFVAALRSRDP